MNKTVIALIVLALVAFGAYRYFGPKCSCTCSCEQAATEVKTEEVAKVEEVATEQVAEGQVPAEQKPLEVAKADDCCCKTEQVK